MKRISSRWTYFYKRVFPVFWLGFIALVTLTGWLPSRRMHTTPAPLLIMPVLMGVIGYVVFRRLIFDLVDEVWDDGTALIVKNGGVEERVSLSNVINISHSSLTRPERVTLRLRDAGSLGKEITFLPPFRLVWFRWFSRNPIVDELIERVDRARRAV